MHFEVQKLIMANQQLVGLSSDCTVHAQSCTRISLYLPALFLKLRPECYHDAILHRLRVHTKLASVAGSKSECTTQQWCIDHSLPISYWLSLHLLNNLFLRTKYNTVLVKVLILKKSFKGLTVQKYLMKQKLLINRMTTTVH